MAMGTCMECGSQVSEHANTCPKCGTPLTYGRRHPWRFAAAVVITILVGVIGLRVVEANRISKLPRLPVEVKFRPSLLGPRAGYVVLIQNTSDQALPIMATLKHSEVNDGKRFDLYVPAQSQSDIGRLSGWIAERGDQIALQNSGYQPWHGSIP
jgi:hypothetical protein